MSRNPDGDAGEGRRRRWPLWLVVALPVALVGVIAGGWSLAGGSFSKNREYPRIDYGGPVGVPGQVLLNPLRSRPVPGWRIDLLRLLPGAVRPRAELFGYSAQTAYFAVADSQGRAWVLGVNVDDGTPAFAPVDLGSTSVDCFTNGPRRLLCLTPSEAWVLDAQSGSLLSRGRTDLRAGLTSGDAPQVEQAGDYVVASKAGVGVFGIGDRGQPTWTVPGAGDRLSMRVVRGDEHPGDPSVDIAVTKTGEEYTVFSAVDGTVLTDDASLVPALFVGGYLVEDDGRRANRYVVHDPQGDPVGSYQPPDGYIAVEVTDGQLPVMSVSADGADGLVVLTPAGVPMEYLAADALIRTTRIVGGAMFVGPEGMASDPGGAWTKYDLRSGDENSTCRGLPLDGRDYIGSDGTVVIGATDRSLSSSDEPIVAVDTDTCAQLWQLPKAPTWAIGSTLVQAPPDGGEIISLVAPR